MTVRHTVRAIALVLPFVLGACGGAAGPGSAPVATAAPAPAGSAAASSTAPISVRSVWSRPALGATAAGPGTAAGGGMMGGGGMAMGEPGNGAVYLTITNSGPVADRLVKASTDIAKSTELHTVTMVSGVMQMRPVEGIDVAASSDTLLQPGGFHIMLVGLTRDLKVGDGFPVTLTFQKAGTITVRSDVKAQ